MGKQFSAIKVASIELPNFHQPVFMQNLDCTALVGKYAESAKILDGSVHVNDRKTRCIGQIELSDGNDQGIPANSLEPDHLLAEQICDARKRGPLHISQPFPNYTRVENGGAPQSQRKLGMSPDDLRDILMRDGPDHAVGLRRNCVVRIWQNIPMQIAEIAGILKAIDLPAAIRHRPVPASDPSQQDSRLRGAPARAENVSAANHLPLDLDSLHQGLQIFVPVDSQFPEFAYQRVSRGRSNPIR